MKKCSLKYSLTGALPAQWNSSADFSPDLDVPLFDRQWESRGEFLETKKPIPRGDKGNAIIIF